MEALTACWIAAGLLMGLVALGGCVWVIRSHRKAPSSIDGYGFVAFFILGVAGLFAIAVGLVQAGGNWALVGGIGANVMLQPLWLYLFAGAAYKLGMALAGRVVYVWRVVPPGEFTAAEYRALRWYCLSQGVVGCLFAACLGWCCLQLLR